MPTSTARPPTAPIPSPEARPIPESKHCDSKRKTVRLDKDGVPVDPNDWTKEDWADLYFGMIAIKARIAARHSLPEADEAGK